MKRFVITHVRDGIFVGHCMGLLFWSNCDTVDQPSVPTAPTKFKAIEMIAWIASHDPDVDEACEGYDMAEVECVGDYATVDELRAAGLDVSPFDARTLVAYDHTKDTAQ